MKFSIIIPSYNQDAFIEKTFENLLELKEKMRPKNYFLEVLLFDSCSNEIVQEKIKKHQHLFDFIEIKKDAGQYDAINKGLDKITGDYWSWLNTDDLIDINGFLKLAAILEKEERIDYIYGGIKYIDSHENVTASISAKKISLDYLVNTNTGIYQPGSFFKKNFSDNIGKMENYVCCFDYEYMLRALKNKAVIKMCDFNVAYFRLHESSKTGSKIPLFVKEQLEISKKYGRIFFSKHTLIASLRQIKHRLFLKK